MVLKPSGRVSTRVLRPSWPHRLGTAPQPSSPEPVDLLLPDERRALCGSPRRGSGALVPLARTPQRKRRRARLRAGAVRGSAPPVAGVAAPRRRLGGAGDCSSSRSLSGAGGTARPWLRAAEDLGPGRLARWSTRSRTHPVSGSTCRVGRAHTGGGGCGGGRIAPFF
eukprot:scaffold907_cov398-Prasinococcus_capsulatus_cf.AAC.18